MKKRLGNSEIAGFVVIVLLVVGLWLLSWFLIDQFIITASGLDSNTAARGQFGDKFGAINSLFAGLAFAGIIFTILLQRGDLQETRRSIR